MIKPKTAEQIEAMRAAGAVVAEALALAREMATPGTRLRTIDRACEALIRQRGATPTFKGYRGFPSTLCTSVDEVAVHGIPGWRKLKAGEVLSVDCGATLDGWTGDAAITVAVGEVAPQVARLLEITRAALMAAIDAARLGAHLGDIGARVEATVAPHGFGVVREYCGHGIGRDLHEHPQVPNVGVAGTGPRIALGWCLAIEPIVTLGSPAIHTRSDGWTIATRDRGVAAHFEHTIAVTEQGPRILTLTGDGRHP